MLILIPFLLTCMSAGTVVYLTKRRFEEVLPLTIMAGALLVFLSGFLSNLNIGYILYILFALSFPVLLVVNAFLKDKKQSVIKNYLTPGFLIFCVLFVFLFILNIKRQFTVWDEFMHWGPMVKEMFRLDKFYSVAESVIPMHKDYPPIISILQVLWCKLAGGYREGYLYISLQVLVFSMFLPALSKLKFKKSFAFYIKLFLIFVFIISSALLLTVAEAKFYTTIYIDCFLAVIFAYGLFLSVCEKNVTVFNLIRLSVCLAFLLLSKQMGLVFFLLILSAFALNYLITHYAVLKSEIRQKTAGKRLVKMGVTAFCISVIPYLFSYIWDKYISAIGVERQFNISSIDLSTLPGIFLGTVGEEWQHVSLRNYLGFILKGTLVEFPIRLTYWQLVLVCAAILYFAGMYAKKYIDKKSTVALNAIVTAGSAGYAFAMLLLYTYSFGSYEGPILACVDRYLDTYIFAAFILAAMLFLFAFSSSVEAYTKKTIEHLCGILILLWTVWIPAGSLAQFIPSVISNPSRDSLPYDTQIVTEKTPENAKIFMISQGDRFYCTYYVTNYKIMPRSCNSAYYSLGEPYRENDIRTKNITLDEWKAMLSEWDYLFLQHIDDQFIEKYSEVFSDDAKIESGQIYEIIKKDGKFSSLNRVE